LNGELIVTGVILIVAIYWFTNFYITPSIKQQITQSNTTCNFDPFLGIPRNDTASPICEQYGIYNLILTWQTAFYILGAISLIFGFLSGGKKQRVEVVREIYHEPQREEYPETSPENPPTI